MRSRAPRAPPRPGSRCSCGRRPSRAGRRGSPAVRSSRRDAHRPRKDPRRTGRNPLLASSVVRPASRCGSSMSSSVFCTRSSISRLLYRSAIPPPGRRTRCDLGQRAVGIEPVEGLRADDGVDLASWSGMASGGPFQRLDLRETRSRCSRISSSGSTAIRCTARYERARELPGAGGEIEHGAARADPQPLAHPRDRLGRVAGPAALVTSAALENPRAAISLMLKRA